MEIAATPATVPPAIAPVFELCPLDLCPTCPGLDVVVFEELPTVGDKEDVLIAIELVVCGGEPADLTGVTIVLGPIEEEKEGPSGPSIVPGPSSGLSEEVGREKQPGEREK